jgi:hypothetical protein
LPFGLEPGVISAARASPLGELFRPGKLVNQIETRAADRAARYIARANRASASPQQHHLAQGIALGN